LVDCQISVGVFAVHLDGGKCEAFCAVVVSIVMRYVEVGKMAQFDGYCDDSMSVLIYSAATIYFSLDMSTEEKLYCSNVTSFYSSV
jgi:hypothetical protein